jgi:hypothetical protein
MIPTRRRLVALVASVGVLAIAASAPVAGAALPAGFPVPAATGLGPFTTPVASAPIGGAALGADALPAGDCAHKSVEGQGATAGTTDQVCVGSGLVFIGPAIGQVATVIGPTVIGPAVIGTSVVSAGDVAAGP